MTDVTVKSMDDAPEIYDGLHRHTSAERLVAGLWKLATAPAHECDRQPYHNHEDEALDPDPDDLLAPRRGRGAPGHKAARVERPRPLRATRAAHHLPAPDRHKRLPHRHLATACAARRAESGPRTSAALSRSAARRPRRARDR